ncbi:MAG: DNA polymerase I [Acetobacteraceae bacterium]|nr:DNA polymerase I [Acetobacteraceae bacterium]
MKSPLHLILIDGSGFIFRAFHALPAMNRADGTPVNAVFGFCNMLAKLIREQGCTHLAVVFDAGRATFRNRIYDQYKAHRPDPPDDLLPQFGLIRDAAEAFCVPVLELPDWEADDLIASYCRMLTDAGGQVTIVSSDKDLMQLIRPGVSLLDPIKQKPIGPAEVADRFGVPPEKLIDVQALMGDTIDNVPGVPGIGPKNAAQLVNEFGGLEGILAAAPSMKPSKRRDNLIAYAEAARLSRQLVTLREDAPLPLPLEALALRLPERDRLNAWLMSQGFRSIAARLGYEGGSGATVLVERPAPPPAGARQIEAEHPKVPFGPYRTVISTREHLQQWARRAETVGHLAIVAKTAGSGPDGRDLIGIALATAPGEAAYLPLRHTSGDSQLRPEAAAEILQRLLGDRHVLKIFRNTKADTHVLTRSGFTIPAPQDDITLISYAQEAGLHDHSLEEMAERHLEHTPAPLEDVTGTGRNRLPFSEAPLGRAAAYASEQADVVLRLWQTLRPRLRSVGALALYEQVERRLTPVLLQAEQAGIRVDPDELRRMSEDFDKRMAAMEKDIHRLAGRSFNLGSPKQLGEVLFDEMKLPGGKRMKTGAWGTDAGVLQSLADQGHELPALILDWRQLAKLKTTYADALVGQINHETGRVHTSFAMAATSTGRLSSNDPNLQNIPIRTEEGVRIRRAFIAEPGHLLVSCDYSQIELRLLAHVADIPALRASFIRGEDIHARTASEVFGIPMEGMDPLTRRRAKAINFGIIYGISAFGLARQLGISAGEARFYIDAYFARYPGIRAYMERTKEEARITGYVTTPFGRRCWIPGIADKNPAKRGYAERQAINAPLQGGAADIVKRAMVRLPRALAAAGLKARMLLQVHDELLFEAPREEAGALASLAKTVMESAVKLSVPLIAETGFGRSWADAH